MLPSKIVIQCVGCDKIVNGNQCAIYTDPSVFSRPDRWETKFFMCPIKGYAESVASTQTKVVRVGQQKQKKKGRL